MVETNDLGELKSLIQTLLARIEQLEAENADLRLRLAQNSTNSHQPPASDGYAKKPLIKPALPKVGGKKAGGQPGHPGKTLHMVECPDVVYTHKATHCTQCGRPLRGEGQLVSRRQVFDLPAPRLWVEEHQLRAHQCTCGCVQTGQFPLQVAAPVQYGPRINAQSVLLNVDYRLPFAKVSQLWTDLTGYAYNPATLTTVQTTLCEQLAPIEEYTKTQLSQANVCHFDETGVRLGGRLEWVHVACNEHYTHLFVHPKRGPAGFTIGSKYLRQVSQLDGS